MISVDDLVEYCKADDADYDRILYLRDAAVAFVNEPGGQYFGPVAEVTENIVWRGGVFRLASTPVGDVTFTRWDGSSFAAVDSTGFVVDGRLVYGYGTTPATTGATHLQATYEAGYTADTSDPSVFDAPEDIKQWVRMVVHFWYRNPDGAGELAEEHERARDSILRKHR